MYLQNITCVLPENIVSELVQAAKVTKNHNYIIYFQITPFHK